MSDDEQSATMERADSENDSEDENAGYKDDEEGGQEDEEEEEEEDPSLRPIQLKLQHGANGNWGLREMHHLHKAKGGCPVKDGKELGQIFFSKSGKVWEKVSYTHVDLLGGVPLQGGEQQMAPHVRFIPPEGAPETDDADWARPVCAKVMEYLQPLWLKAINAKFKDEDKRKRVLAYYKPVLEWKPSQLNGQRLNPVAFGTGDRGFIPLERQLKSIIVKPPVQSRKATLEHGDAPASKKQKGGSSVDTESVDDECPFESLGPGSRVWKLGEVGKVHTFNGIDGNVYAALLP